MSCGSVSVNQKLKVNWRLSLHKLRNLLVDDKVKHIAAISPNRFTGYSCGKIRAKDLFTYKPGSYQVATIPNFIDSMHAGCMLVFNIPWKGKVTDSSYSISSKCQPLCFLYKL